MALSRLAREFAAEINNHDWSDAPYRIDRAGHQRHFDRGWETAPRLDNDETARIRMNVMWVVAQVLGHADPNFNPWEFAEACGVPSLTSSGRPSGVINNGLRYNLQTGEYSEPGVSGPR